MEIVGYLLSAGLIWLSGYIMGYGRGARHILAYIEAISEVRKVKTSDLYPEKKD